MFLVRLRQAGPEFEHSKPLFQAESEDEVRAIWARDPWHESHLVLESVEPWEIRLDGGDAG
jgi:hypothetical protein